MEDGTHAFLQWTRVQLEGCTRDKLRTRAMDLRDALGLTPHQAPLPSTAALLIDWIIDNQTRAPEVAHPEDFNLNPAPALRPQPAPPGPKESYGFCTIQPYFTMLDASRAMPIMADFVARTKNEQECIYYGWSICGDKFFCREAYTTGAAVNAHLENVGECIGAILASGVATLDGISIHGPAQELELVKPGTAALGTGYYEVHSGFTNFDSFTSDKVSLQTHVSIQPTFTILDMAKVEPIMAEFVARTGTEAGCLYYGWTILQGGNKLFCREAYKNGAALNAHLANVGDLLNAILQPGVATLDNLEIHGPAEELDVCRPGTEALGTKYYEIYSGFSKYGVPGELYESPHK